MHGVLQEVAHQAASEHCSARSRTRSKPAFVSEPAPAGTPVGSWLTSVFNKSLPDCGALEDALSEACCQCSDVLSALLIARWHSYESHQPQRIVFTHLSVACTRCPFAQPPVA